MATSLGINNPNSHYNRSLRTAQLDGIFQSAVKLPAMFTIRTYAEKIAGRYEAALMLINGGGSPASKGERLAIEYETQLIMLADYADKMAEAGM